MNKPKRHLQMKYSSVRFWVLESLTKWLTRLVNNAGLRRQRDRNVYLISTRTCASICRRRKRHKQGGFKSKADAKAWERTHGFQVEARRVAKATHQSLRKPTANRRV